jgi:hypothetical protein
MATNRFTSDLVAPCGMNCGLCKAYLAYTHGIPMKRGKVTHCAGCLPRAKYCYLKRGCKKLGKNQIQSCSQCDTIPCKQLAHLDKRYRERFSMSMIENLRMIKVEGLDLFLKKQEERYRCPNCGDVVCVHDGKCYSCGYVRR